MTALFILALLVQACSSPATPTDTTTIPPATSNPTPPSGTTTSLPASKTPQPVPIFSYKIINTFPHDRNAFTEGLIYEDGFLYEGTGRYGQSSLRKVALESGTIIQRKELSSQYFGEGITIHQNTIIQLTWQSHIGFVYDKSSFELIRQFDYPTEGWGITTDGKRLIMSDGTSTLHFLNPETFTETGQLQITDNGVPLIRINELEWVKDKIYANIWLTNRIAIISLESGFVTGWIDLKGLKESQDKSADVLNGIAYDAAGDRLFVTGKLWQNVFEIMLMPLTAE